jgi:lipoate-protein ligase A
MRFLALEKLREGGVEVVRSFVGGLGVVGDG